MHASSMTNAVNLRQDPRPLVIGERLNVMGSAASKKCMFENDIDGMVAIARQQVEEEGAHCIDICMANTEGIDETDLILKLVKRLSLEVQAPLVIDSTEHDVIAAALKHAPGLPIINSISLEEGRFEENMQTMRKYGCPAIAMCAGPAGIEKTARKKVEMASMIYEKATKQYGIKPEQLIFDPAAFTLCTGDAELRHTAVETLNSITQIKEMFPKSYTSLGLSNISFGLNPPARRVLNSVFLYYAVRHGLDAAIINMSRITAYADIPQAERTLAERVIFDKDKEAESDFVNYFEEQQQQNTGGSSTSKKEDSLKALNEMSASARCTYKIIHRIPDGLQEDVKAAIRDGLEKQQQQQQSSTDDPRQKEHNSALGVLNDALLPAMKTVGEKFGSGELILPYVLRSAECMKEAVREMERHLISDEGASKGTIVLGTVYGDVHDIGKNLVKTIMQNNGYTIHDLGKQVPVSVFAEKIKETNADAVGLSALLVSTSKQMQIFVEYARDNNLNIPILCGGAAINSDYVKRMATTDTSSNSTAKPGTGTPYESGMFYCRDMFDGLRVIDGIITDKDALLSKYNEQMSAWQQKESKKAAAAASAPSTGNSSTNIKKQSSVKPLSDIPIPRNRKLGDVTHMHEISFSKENIWSMIDKKSLFKLQWGVRGRAANSSTVAEFEDLFVKWQGKIAQNKWFEPYAVYGFFRCRSSADALHVYDSDDNTVKFDFPRSSRESNLCLADYFNSEKDDVVALQIVTVGARVADVIEQYNKSDMYTDAYYLHGMAVEAAEGLAEYCNRKVCQDLQQPKALRYSWGYPSCPDTGQHRQVWRLLRPDDVLHLTDAGQIVPEFSTAAIVVPHPEAKYFVP